MLDVHPPQHGIHGVRDFFIHLLTITAGLLIALGLEQSVEVVHHRHQRMEAEANLRQELQDNARDLKSTLEEVRKERQILGQVLPLTRARAAGQKVSAEQVSLGLSFATLHEASWGSASATGVLNYMDYAEVKRFAEAYQMQRQFLNRQDRMIDDYLQEMSHMEGDVGTLNVEAMSSVEAGSLAADLQHTLVELVAMEQFGEVVERDYAKAMNGS